MPPKKNKKLTENIIQKRTATNAETQETQKRMKIDEKFKNEDQYDFQSENDSVDPNADKFTVQLPEKSFTNKSKIKEVTKKKEKEKKEQKQWQYIHAQKEDKQSFNESGVEQIDTSSKQFAQTKRSAANKANNLLTKLKQQDEKLNKVIGCDSELEEIEESEMLADDPIENLDDVAKQQNDGRVEPSAKLEKVKKGQFPGKDIIEYIHKISNGFCKDCKTLELHQQTLFKDWPREQVKRLKTWYKRRCSKQTNSDFVVPHVDHPNEVLMNLLNETVDIEYRSYIAHILETHLPPPLQSHFTNRALAQILKDIENYNNDNIEELVEILQNAPIHLRLKATAKAISHLQQKGLCNNQYKLSWFNHCIKPSLTVSAKVNYLEFDKHEIQSIKDVCEFSNPYQMSEDEAYGYLKLLKYGNVLQLDLAIKHFVDKSDVFWMKVLEQICGINKDVAEIWIQHKNVMITDAVYKHYKVQNMSKEFAQTLSIFQKLSSQEVSDLFHLSHQRGFQLLKDLLNSKQKHDFTLFQKQSSLFINLQNPNQIESCRVLSQIPLSEWHKYKNQIVASSAIVGNEEAWKIVKDVLSKMYTIEDIEKLPQDVYAKFEKLWDKAFDELQEKVILQKFGWQKELVIHLTYLLLTMRKKNTIVTLCTGHGKSVIIQLLADILVEISGDTIIVCLTDYLAHQGRTNYGSRNVRQEKQTYMCFSDFIKRKPDPNTNVVFDEIDRMMGVNSFNVVDQDQYLKPVYSVNLMKQWKSVIGFSGTISESTVTQLRAELKDPICIDIPSLRTNGNSNKIVYVVRISDQIQLFNRIQDTINEFHKDQANFIVVFEDKDILHSFSRTSACLTPSEARKCIIFDDFSQNFALIMRNLNEVAKDEFIVLTTKDGSRGVDYKGINPAHVIIAFKPESYSECVQALGRGCRELTSFAQGSIICEDPLTEDASDYLVLLQAADDELCEAMKLNCKLARLFHNVTIKKQISKDEVQYILEQQKLIVDERADLTILVFEKLMKKGQNFKNVEGGGQLWDALRKLDTNKRMPGDYYQKWDY